MARTNHINGLFVRVAQRDMHCAAFRALTLPARYAVFALDLHYWETQRLNPIVLTQRWLGDQLEINPKTAARIIEQLEAHWFLELVRRGKLTGPNNERGQLYRMAWHPTNDGAAATFAYRDWSPLPIVRGASRSAASTNLFVPPGAGTSGRERTNFGSVGMTAKEMLERMKNQRPANGNEA